MRDSVCAFLKFSTGLVEKGHMEIFVTLLISIPLAILAVRVLRDAQRSWS